MKANKIIAFLLGTAALFSCEKEIEFKGDTADPVLVVNAIQQNDSTFRIYLERSIFFLSDEEPGDQFIKSGATVKVTDLSSGEVFTMTESTYDNVYDFPFITKASTRYKIEVTHPDYKPVSSEILTVANVPLLSADTTSYTEDGSLWKKAVLKWNDPAGENYYILRLFYEDPLYDYFYQMNFYTNDEVISSMGFDPLSSEKPSFNDLVFTDELFDGEQKQITIDFNTYKGMTPQEDPIYTYRLISISKEAYLYYQSAENSGGDSPFSEPVKVYSNIEGGFGIFGSISTSQIVK